ncbi:EamA family transporter RarD [Robertmurraya korlensis]|uniref:EamA family transporter RarD n=1 Tax=Robertmurraya korlensis TaxID=519977 RepID=UPI00203E23AA|nr:EamA family transporter RarD [Robertmurraya korlensis]MCM3599223.1 EamA family transporter RarD [Robertmurraya korlensis]
MEKKEIKQGVLYAGLSYLIWGILPIYWKLLEHVNAEDILANRIFWSFVFMMVVLFFSQKLGDLLTVLKGFRQNRKEMYALIIASLLISTNWFIYIWAVNHHHMIEASLGYYINPLVSVLLGVIFLKEKLSPAQYVSFIIAGIGVLILGISYGKFPWISIVLALSFGVYGLAKKMIKVDSAVGLTLETMVVTPFALAYMVFLFFNGEHAIFAGSVTTDLLLVGAGAATALPLLYFAKGAQKIPLSMLGLLQYIAPTITLILGVLVYGEQFTKHHLQAFIFIWSALTIYSLSKTKLFATTQRPVRKRFGA